MACGFTIRWMSTKWSTCAFLVCISVSLCFGGKNTRSVQFNMTSAISACAKKGGLIGPAYLMKIQEQMGKTNVTSAWINVNFVDVFGKWMFVDGSSLDNPTEYFENPESPIGCGSVHPGNRDGYFEENNCLYFGLPALCQKKKNQCLGARCAAKEDFFITQITRNWFDARHACLNRGGDLAILTTMACIPKIGQPDDILWTGLHSLNERVVENESVTNVLANITMEGNTQLPEVARGKECLITVHSATVLWDIVPCSEKHHAFCLQDLGGKLTGTGNEASSSDLFGLLWIVIVEYLVFP